MIAFSSIWPQPVLHNSVKFYYPHILHTVTESQTSWDDMPNITQLVRKQNEHENTGFLSHQLFSSVRSSLSLTVCFLLWRNTYQASENLWFAVLDLRMWASKWYNSELSASRANLLSEEAKALSEWQQIQSKNIEKETQ